MATVAPRRLKVGIIIDKTLGVVEHTTKPVAIYVAILTAINVAVKYFSVSLTAPMQQLGIGLVQFAIGITAAYLLLDVMLRLTGLRTRTDEDVFFPYLGLSILYSLGVFVGFLVFIIPGLLFMARWSIAQPLLVARGEGVMKALGESWEKTRGSEFQILGAALALLILLIAIMIACSALFDPADPVGIVISQLASSAISVLSLAMGVALYGLIEGRAVAPSPSH